MFDREYDEGDIIIRQGDEGDNFYVLGGTGALCRSALSFSGR